MKPACQFDPVAHRYTIRGRDVPSVTQVLRDMLPGWRAGEWYMERGRAVHAAAAFIAQGKAFEHDPQIDGQVGAIRRFFAECKPVVLAVEQQVFSERYQYAGTFDLLTRVFGGHASLMLVDYKSALGPSVPYQLAAYALAYGEPSKRPCCDYGVGVELREDGTYKLSEVCDLRRYRSGWLSLLSSYNIRRQCGINEAKEGESDG